MAARYRQETRTRKYILDNGSTLQVKTTVDVNVCTGLQEGPRRLGECKLDGKTVKAPRARELAEASRHKII